MDRKKDLAEYSFFRTIPAAEQTEIRRLGRLLDLRNGKVAYYQGEKADTCYFLVSGHMQRTKYRSDETAISLGPLNPGSWSGLAECVLESLYLYDAIAAESCSLFYLSAQNLKEALQLPVFTRKVLECLAKENALLHYQLEMNQPQTRIITSILAAVEGKGPGMMIVHTTQDLLAEITGTSRETVNKHLNRLQKSGYITIQRGQIEVRDPDALRQML